MAQINLGVALNFDDSDYKKGIKGVEQSLKKWSTSPAFIKLKLDDKDFRKQYQDLAKELQKRLEKVGATTYKTSKGTTKTISGIGSMQSAYRYFLEQSTNTKLTSAEQSAYKKREEVMRQYLNLLKEIGLENARQAKNRKLEADMPGRLAQARRSGAVAAERRRAYAAEFADEKKQKKDDELYRRRYTAFATEQTKWEKEQADRIIKLQKEADKRSSEARRIYDRQIKSGTDTRTPELEALRQVYQRGDSMFVNGSRPVRAEGLEKQLELLKQQRVENEKILAATSSKSKSDKTYRKLIEDENKAIKKQIALLENAKKQIDYISNPPKGQFQSYINQISGKRVDPEYTQLKEKMAELERQSAKAAKAEQQRSQLTAKGLRDQARAARDASRAYRQAYGSVDASRNAFARGGNSSKELADMRRFYQEQEKLANQQNRINTGYEKQGMLLRSLTSLASRYFSVYSVIRFAENVAKTTGYFEQQQVALEGILQSATEAKTVLNDIMNFALKSPYQTKELVTFTKQLSAFGIDSKDLFPTVTKLADVAAGLGVDMGRIILAYGQVKSAAVLRGQELRQFTEAGIPMVDALAKKFTALNDEVVTTADVFELISKRQVPFEMVAEILSDMASEGGRFYKMQENITDTLYGQIEKLKDMWTLSMNDMGKTAGGFLNDIIKLLQVVVSNVKSISVGMAVAFSATTIAKSIRYLLILAGVLKGTTAELRKIAILKQTIFSSSARFLTTSGIGLAAGLLAGIIANAVSKANELKKELKEIDASFTKETNKMIEGVTSLLNKLRSAKKGSEEWNKAIDTLKANYGEYININDELIQGLSAETNMTAELKTKYDKLNESISASIRLKKELEQLNVEQEKIESSYQSDARGNKFWGTGYSSIISNQLVTQAQINAKGMMSINESLNEMFGTKYKKRADFSIEKRLNDVFERTFRDFTKAGFVSVQDFVRIYQEKLDSEFITHALPDILRTGIAEAVFYRSQGLRSYNAYIEGVNKRSGLSNSSLDYLIRIEKIFKENKPELSGTDLDKYYQNDVFYRNLLRGGSIQGIIGDLARSEGEDAEKAFRALNLVLNDSTKSAREISNAFNTFYDAFGSGERRTLIEEIGSLYAKHTDAMSADEEVLARRINELELFKTKIVKVDGKDKSLQEYLEDWSPAVLGEQTVQQTRDKLLTEYNTLTSERKKYESKNQDNLFGDEIAYIDAKIEVIKRLAQKDLYNVNLESEGNDNRYARIRITNFFEEFLSVITKAEDAMKSVIGVTGYTNQLGEFVKGLESDNFLRAFFEEGGNPFKKIFAKMAESGVTEFLPEFNQSTLENMFRSVGWEEGKEISIPDFQAMYKKVVEQIAKLLTNLRNRRAQYAKDTSEYNSLDSAIKSLQEFQLRSIETIETRWGGNEIENKIDAAIKELTNINGNLENIKTQRDMFDSISKSGNYLTAQQAIYGNQDYKRFDAVGEYRNAILKMLSKPGGKGIADTNPGIALMNLLNSGDLNINSLSALLDIMKALNEEVGPVNEEEAEQFKKVMGTITSAIKGMSKAVLEENEKYAATRTDDMVVSDNIINLAQSYSDALDLIDKKLKESIAEAQKLLDSAEINQETFNKKTSDAETNAAERRLNALQNYYNGLRSNLGGTELPQWIKQLYGDPTAQIGISKQGSILDKIFNSGNLENTIGNILAEKVSSGAMSATEAAKAMETSSASIAMVDAIIKAVYQAINSIVEFSKEMIEVLERTDNRLNLSRGTDGKLYDKDGNINISEDYYNKQNSREIAKMAFDAVGNFNQHVMDGWEKLKSGDFLGATFEVIMSIADLVADIVGIGDAKIRDEQEELIRSNDRLVNAMENLEHALKSSVGNEKYNIYSEQLKNLKLQLSQYEQLLALENQKKSGDAEKAEDFAKQAIELGRQIDDLVNNIRSEILGTADDLASSLTDALVGSFREGTNAARAWRDAVKSYIGDILKQELMTKVIAPFFDDIMNDFFGVSGMTDDEKEAYFESLGSEGVLKLFGDVGRVNDFVNALNSAGITLTDLFNNLPDELQDYIAFNGSTSALSGGISGITEDTARTLEGLANSMLMQQVLTNQHLSLLSSSAFAQVQMSWFNDMLIQTKAIRVATEGLNSAVSDMRNGIRPMSVTIA